MQDERKLHYKTKTSKHCKRNLILPTSFLFVVLYELFDFVECLRLCAMEANLYEHVRVALKLDKQVSNLKGSSCCKLHIQSGVSRSYRSSVGPTNQLYLAYMYSYLV